MRRSRRDKGCFPKRPLERASKFVEGADCSYSKSRLPEVLSGIARGTRPGLFWTGLANERVKERLSKLLGDFWQGHFSRRAALEERQRGCSVHNNLIPQRVPRARAVLSSRS